MCRIANRKSQKLSFLYKMVENVPGPEVIKLFSCSTHLSMKSLLINMKMPAIVGMFIFISKEKSMFGYV